MGKVKAMAWGFGGAGIAIGVWVIVSSMWVDHQRVNVLWDLAVQQAQANQARQVVPPPQVPQPSPTAKK